MGGSTRASPRASAGRPFTSVLILALGFTLAGGALGGCGSSSSGNVIPVPAPEKEVRPLGEALAELEEWTRPGGQAPSVLYPGDSISIDVKNHGEYSIALKVIPANGIVGLTGLRDRVVNVIGKTPQELEKEVAEAYSEILVNPYITVLVKDYATRVVYISGAVRNAGKLSMPSDTRLTLIRALIEAGDLTTEADSTAIRILRDVRETGRQRTSPPIDLDVLYRAGIDIPLMPNDTIQVPKKQVLSVSIWGKGVMQPGTYPWEEGLTITRLIPMAGGLNKFADLGSVRILRRGPEGQQSFEIDLNRITENRDPDFPLRPGDVVRIDDTFF
jgi:polysaccharide export outer membrane protein